MLDRGAVIDLAGGLQLRRSLSMGAHRVELTGFSEGGTVSILKSLGLVSEIIAWRLRLFVPVSEDRPGDPRRAARPPSADRRPLARRRGLIRTCAVISQAGDLARRLAREAEAVCRHYLPHGRRHGRYWVTGDVDDTPGRSLYVRLYGPDSGPGAAGKWSDAATGEHGDLLDLIGRRRASVPLADAIDEARAFLALPRRDKRRSLAPALIARRPARRKPPAVCSLPDVRSPARRPKPICALAASPPGSTGRRCAFTPPSGTARAKRIRAKPGRRCWPRSPILAGTITGIQRSWLDRTGTAKAPIADPRRALGHLLGNGVRFGTRDRHRSPPAKASKRCWRSPRCCRRCR